MNTQDKQEFLRAVDALIDTVESTTDLDYLYYNGENYHVSLVSLSDVYRLRNAFAAEFNSSVDEASDGDWKTLDEILPEMGRAAMVYPDSWRELFEIDTFNGSGELSSRAHLSPEHRYRRKPRTMKYTVERPEPMLEHPGYGQWYWALDLEHPCWSRRYTWTGDAFDRRLFNRGLIYATEEEAAAASKAMVGGE